MKKWGRRSNRFNKPAEADEGALESEGVWALLGKEALQLSPIGLLACQGSCLQFSKGSEVLAPRYHLPDLSHLSGLQKPFASVALAWHLDGIRVGVEVEHPYEAAFFPEIRQGDSVEIFIDTRDVKTSGFATRFCHHFYCLPKAVEGQQAGELTRFRTEDTHEWCDASLLKVKSFLHKDSYSMDLWIPKECLHGYDPEQYQRLGFAYRVNRSGEDPQYFTVTSEDFVIEQQPSLWSSLRLIK